MLLSQNSFMLQTLVLHLNAERFDITNNKNAMLHDNYTGSEA